MAYYDALKTVWGTLTGKTGDKLNAVNAMTVAGPNQDVPVATVEGYLSVNGVLTAMEDWLATNPSPGLARTAAKELLRTVSSPHVTVFRMSDAATYASLETMLNALVANPPAVLTAAQVSALLTMASTTIPWWQANGYPGAFNLNDVNAAGLS